MEIIKELTLAAKLLLPSWNFFNEVSCFPRLDFALLVDPSHGTTTWNELYPQHATSSLGRILFNPWGNLELLEKNFISAAVDHLAMLSQPFSESFPATEAFAILQRLVQSKLNQPPETGSHSHFQFRLVIECANEPEQIIFTSEPLSLSKQEVA